MREVKRPHRCAQCGRSYTKAQWRRNDFWCPKCEKFVCYDCVGYGRICPACGKRTNRYARYWGRFGALMGGTFLMMALLFLALGLTTDSDLWFVWPMIGMGASAAAVSVVLSVLSKRQTRMHERRLSTLPKGTIPLDMRAGYGDLKVQRKWSEANLAASVRSSPMMKAYPDHIYYGLKADWDFPVMTKEERISMTADVQKKGLVWGVGIVVLGVFVTTLGVYLDRNVVVMLLGVMVALVGGMVVFVARYAKEMVQSDAKAKVKVVWKTVGFEAAKEAVEGFLKEQRLEWRLKKTKLPMWVHPKYTYELEDGNEISFTYSEGKDGRVYGWVEVGFRPSGALAARRLQKELDEYLCERDLVRRGG